MSTLMETWRDEYFQKRGKTYKNHVNKFVNFLVYLNKANEPISINLSDVDECVGYYHQKRQIKTRSTMESHLQSIKHFYDYLLETNKTNDIFTQMRYDQFKSDIAKKYHLGEKNKRGYFEADTIKKILCYLDNYFSSTDYFKIDHDAKKKQYIYTTTINLFIKLTLIAPAKRQKICDLRLCDFEEDYHYLRINSIRINIPNSLRRDIKTALSLREIIDQAFPKNDSFLFKYVAGENFIPENLNGWFCEFLKENEIIPISNNRKSYPVEKIMEAAIYNMVTKLTNPAFISKINGVKIASIEEKYYSGQEILNYRIEINEAVNWEIAKSDYYSFI
jgi:hypothetical protein